MATASNLVRLRFGRSPTYGTSSGKSGPFKENVENEALSGSPVFVDFVRPCLAEFLGTLIYVLLGSLSGLVLNYSVRHLTTSLVQALTIYALMHMFGPISGAHFNPSVTLGSVIGGGVRIITGVFMVICQFLGGFIGACLARAVLEREVFLQYATGLSNVDQDLTKRGQAIIVELLMTAFIVLAYLMSGVDSDGHDGPSAASTTASAYAVSSVAAYRLTGASFNPAKSLACAGGLAVFAPDPSWGFLYIYFIGPIVGAILAGLLYRLFFASDERRLLFP